MKKKYLLLFIIIAIFTGCNSEPKEFSYTFIMESVNASYKITLTIDHNKQYFVEEKQIFFYRKSNQFDPIIKKGIINDEEFNEFKKLLTAGNLYKMKDSYGFENEKDQALHDVLYYIIYTADKKEKSITIRLDDSTQFPASFTKLIDFTNQFISKNKGS